MKRSFPVLITLLLLCLGSCVEMNTQLGGGFIPDSKKFLIVPEESFPLEINLRSADSLSGWSNKRMALGAIDDGTQNGLSERSCILTLVPFYRVDPGEPGTAKVVKFSLTAAPDSFSVADKDQRDILQSVNVYALKEPVTSKSNYDINADISSIVDWSSKISAGTPVLNGSDSLEIRFKNEFARKFLTMTDEDLKDIDSYTKKFPGIYLCTNKPSGRGGRFNYFNVQLGYDLDYGTLTGNYASLVINARYNGVQKDSTFLFYFSPNEIYDVDSLLTNSSSGSLPQYCLNLAKQAGPSEIAGEALEELTILGGGGLKAVVDARNIKERVEQCILSNGHDPGKAIINRAQIIFSYVPSDSKYEEMFRYPDVLSPTVRYHTLDTSGEKPVRRVAFGGLTDSSDESADQGNINRSREIYSPDITYHVQELLSSSELSPETSEKKLRDGDYDIWMLLMAYETVVTTTAGNQEMSDLYSMLAYQSYYNNMYGGYGYGGYGYGGYGGYGYGDPYSNYYSYMMAAQYAGSSTTSTSTSLQLDPLRYYKATFYGPACQDEQKRPRLVFSYSVPKK